MDESKEYNKELCEERHERIDERLRASGQKLDNIENCTIKLTQIVEMQTEQINENRARIEEIASRPGDMVGKIVGLALSALAGAICARIVDYLG